MKSLLDKTQLDENIIAAIREHKIAAFTIIFLVTILISRTIALFFNPNPLFGNYELHHFHYGLFILITVSLMMLFKKGEFPLHLSLTAISLGLILDELAFISGKIQGEVTYGTSFKATVFIIMMFLLFLEGIFYRSLRSKKRQQAYNQKFKE